MAPNPTAIEGSSPRALRIGSRCVPIIDKIAAAMVSTAATTRKSQRSDWLQADNPGRITQDEYDKKARELKERQAEIATCIDQHQQGDGEYRTTLESLISLASRAAELFERSKTEQKRQLFFC
jgi:hypothetical protein